MIQCAYGCGMKFAAVDAAFSKHHIYRDGALHILTARDGNNKIMPLAWAMCETESGHTYTWFAQKCHDCGLSPFLNKEAVIFSDRHKGLPKFFESFRAYACSCFHHLIGNTRKTERKSNRKFSLTTIWLVQKAETRAEYDVRLAALHDESPAAAAYVDALDHGLTFQYVWNEKHLGTHDFKTSQIVECNNGVFVLQRFLTPYRQSNEFLQWIGKELADRYDTMLAWQGKHHLLTPYAWNLWEVVSFPTSNSFHPTCPTSLKFVSCHLWRLGTHPHSLAGRVSPSSRECASFSCPWSWEYASACTQKQGPVVFLHVFLFSFFALGTRLHWLRRH